MMLAPRSIVPSPYDQDRVAAIFGRPGRAIGVILASLSAVAIVAPAVIVATAPRIAPHQMPRATQMPVVPRAELPPVDPVNFASISPDDARAFNAMIPFSSDPNPAARPFRLKVAEDSAARAVDCLAAGVLYEAGDDAEGERAVAQVVLNRVRHPAFPKTVCGVVFQGSERRTGCQFTFTCDGALIRHRWSDVAWERARDIARQALNGRVFAAVGYATHYHTDWVVPYWSSSLDKISAVGTHLFFRWTGWWGTPPAFNRRLDPIEPVIPSLAPLSLAHRTGDGDGELLTLDGALAALPSIKPATATPADQDSFLVVLDAKLPPDQYPAFARFSCGDRPYCKFMAWADKAHAATKLPLEPGQSAAMAFSFLRDRANGYEKPLWNCTRYLRPDPRECMKIQLVLPSMVGPTTGVEGQSSDDKAASGLNSQAIPALKPGPVRPRVTGSFLPPRPAATPTPTPTPVQSR